MSKGFMVKHLGSLRPADEEAEAMIRGIGQGEIVAVEVKRPRNGKFHRLFFALIKAVWENLDHDKYPTSEDLRIELEIVTGHYDKRFIDVEGQRYTRS